jgi:hypothetical protein
MPRANLWNNSLLLVELDQRARRAKPPARIFRACRGREAESSLRTHTICSVVKHVGLVSNRSASGIQRGYEHDEVAHER